MAPRPEPYNPQLDSIKVVCSTSCAPTADPDFCFNACFRFQQALLQPVPPGSSGSAATTTFNIWQNQNGAKNTNTAAFTSSSTSTLSQYVAQATEVSSSASATEDALLTVVDTTSSTSTASATSVADSTGPPPQGHPHMPGWLVALSVVIPILCVVFFVIAVISIVRLRRTHKALKQARKDAEAQEKEKLNPEMVEHREDEYVRPPSSQPPANPFDDPEDASGAAALGVSTSTRPEMARSHSDTNVLPPLTTRLSQPVILSSTMDGAYFTGLDTADASSLHNQPISQERDIYPNHDEEPPPPYRPASVPSMSRDSSLRSSTSRPQQAPLLQRTLTNRAYSRCLTGPERNGSQRQSLNVAEEREDGMRNPFDDPEGDRDEKQPLNEPVEEPSSSEPQSQPLSRQVSRLSRRFSLDGDARSVISEPSWMQDDHPDRDEL